MANFLVTHAYQNVWCDPEQDYQHIFMPARLCVPSGVMGSVNVLWRTYNLPTTNDLYQVFQIGQVNPSALGLEAKFDQWTSLADVMTQKLVYANVYTTNGINLPLKTSYIMFTRDRTLILAVKMWPTIADLSSVDLFFRFYSNSFFSSKRSWGDTNVVTSRFYQHQGSTSLALQYQQLYTTFMAKPGLVTLYKNGRYVSTFNPLTLAIGDILEFVYDSSVKKVVDFPISSLQTFESIKDSKIKYLLHYAGAQGHADGTNAVQATIDYRDDIDVYLVKPGTNPDGSANFDGIYFHKNNDDAFRQVTHRDYSVAVPYVVTYQQSNPTWTNLSLLTIRIVIRNAGWDRPLIPEANRINELYKMPDQDIVNAFLGINSTVMNWRAPALENSQYVSIMDSTANQVTQDMVQTAYGYYAIGDLVAPSPILMNGANWISLPTGLQSNATMYEYDTNGHLLGWYPHVLGPEYTPVYTGCTLVEGMVGPASSTLSQVMGQNNIPIQAGLSYRFYVAPIINGTVQTGQWKDVTGDSTKYQIVNGYVQWLVNSSAYQTCVKSDAQHLIYQLSLNPANSTLQFSVQASVSYPNGVVNEVLSIPVGQLDIWLNGHPLIENVDYYCVWPQVVITNKPFLNQDGPQLLTIRGSGFCNSDLTRSPAMETDFVRFGVLSHNGYYNVHDGRVLRIVANGAVWSPDQVIFAEDQIQGTIPNLPNGAPYSIVSSVVPLRSYVDQDTYTMLAADKTIDVNVSAYLTEMLPDTYPTTPDIIHDKYDLVSPFASRIVHDMVNGILSMDNFKGQYSDRDVKTALAAYTYLLAYDPTQKNVDLSHLAIHPHDKYVVINLSIYQYNFLSRAVQIFLNGQVDLTKFLSITWS